MGWPPLLCRKPSQLLHRRDFFLNKSPRSRLCDMSSSHTSLHIILCFHVGFIMFVLTGKKHVWISFGVYIRRRILNLQCSYIYMNIYTISENPTCQLLIVVALVKVNRFPYGSSPAKHMLVLTLFFPTHKSVLKYNIWRRLMVGW